tara:strand:- start:7105 stop:7374 length:270 start_codon:yes stop_codon:yes gene_type:complete
MKQKLLDLQNMLSIKRFEEWINKSRKGDKISYYRGYLCDPWQQKLSPTMSVTNIGKLRKYVYHAYLKGTVALVQKRHDDMDYEYIAQRI